MRINLGCGQTPTSGWRNYDNSLSLRLSRIPLLPWILRTVRLIDHPQYNFIKFARTNNIQYGDATNGLPVPDESCEVLYSSHMLEHLDKTEANKFLDEAFRLLRPGGVLRIAVPDIRKKIEAYNESGDADEFLDSTHLCVPKPKSLAHRLRLLVVGLRHHQWMYDGNSLIRILEQHGFSRAEITPAGATKIPDHEPLNLRERETESVYVEAEKPSS